MINFYLFLFLFYIDTIEFDTHGYSMMIAPQLLPSTKDTNGFLLVYMELELRHVFRKTLPIELIGTRG